MTPWVTNTLSDESIKHWTLHLAAWRLLVILRAVSMVFSNKCLIAEDTSFTLEDIRANQGKKIGPLDGSNTQCIHWGCGLAGCVRGEIPHSRGPCRGCDAGDHPEGEAG